MLNWLHEVWFILVGFVVGLSRYRVARAWRKLLLVFVGRLPAVRESCTYRKKQNKTKTTSHSNKTDTVILVGKELVLETE